MFSSQFFPPTKYDLHFTILKISVRVHPVFWVLAVLIGSSGDILLLPIWIVAIFVGILVHELGHALAFRRYGQQSQILLHFMGGTTSAEPVYWGGGYANVGLTANQHIFIALAGPGAGFLFAVFLLAIVRLTGGSFEIAWLLGFIPLPVNLALPFGGRIVAALVSALLSVTIFWGVINLVPVYSMDGGEVARNLFLQADPVGGIRKSLWLSMVAGVIAAVVCLVFFRSFFLMFLFGILAYQSYQALRNRF